MSARHDADLGLTHRDAELRLNEANPGVEADSAGSTSNQPEYGIGVARQWAVIIPVKPAAVGKSRLEVAGVDRVQLARAIALDTIAAAAACDAVAQVFVVTDDGGLVSLAFDIPGLRFVPEGETRGIDAAVALGAETASDRMPRAALLGDLPALRPSDLAEALHAASSLERGVVADAEGTGTTLVTARAGVALKTSFGDGSYARHLTSGCISLELDEGTTLRRDVDTAAQLDAAAALTLGRRTAALLAPQNNR